MSTYKVPSIEKRTLWEGYKKKCFYCKEPLVFDDIHIDHILPEKLINNPNELERFKIEYNLHPNFHINSYYNLSPACSRCNLRKKDQIFDKLTGIWLFEAIQNYERLIRIEKRLKELKKREKHCPELLSSFGRLANSGLNYYHSKKYFEGIQYYEDLRLLAENNHDLHGEAACLTHLGYLYELAGDYQQAIELYNQALIKTSKIFSPEIEGIILGNMGSIYAALKYYSRAINFYKKALEIWQANGCSQSELLVLTNLEKLYRESKNYNEAIECNKRLLAILKPPMCFR